MLRQHSLLLSLVVALFVSVSSVWAKNVTVQMDDKRLAFPNATSSTGGWTYYDTGLCSNDGGILYTYTKEDWVRLRFNGTAVYVVFAEYDMAAPTNVTIDGVQANVTAQDGDMSLYSSGCQTRTLFATNMTNTNHTVTVAYAGTGTTRTVINKIIYDDGSETPKADPTATRAAFTIGDTGATTPTATPSAAPSESGCGSHCKTLSIGGAGSLIVTLLVLWCLWRCCCGTRRKEVHTVAIVRPPSPPRPQPIILVAALEVQETHILLQSQNVQRNSAAPAPPAYEHTNYK